MSNCKKCGCQINGFWELCEACELDSVCRICGSYLMPEECIICETCLENRDD